MQKSSKKIACFTGESVRHSNADNYCVEVSYHEQLNDSNAQISNFCSETDIIIVFLYIGRASVHHIIGLSAAVTLGHVVDGEAFPLFLRRSQFRVLVAI